MMDLVTSGKLKFSQKFIFRLALTLKPYHIERWNSLWMNVSTDTGKEPTFIQIVGGKDFFCVEMTHFPIPISSFLRLEWLAWGSFMVAQITTWLHVWQITRSFPKGVWGLGTRLRTAMDEEVKLPSMCDHEQNCGFILFDLRVVRHNNGSDLKVCN